ncbi:MAG: SIMPL domain-containing protein [Betaproteobacteria bacterium]
MRADAIRAALHKGQDYASALGGTIVSVVHVADAGLLGGDTWDRQAHRANGDMSLGYSGGPDSASLDPVPQELGTTIEARLTATIGPLPNH